jgi:hypothetical protein
MSRVVLSASLALSAVILIGCGFGGGSSSAPTQPPQQVAEQPTQQPPPTRPQPAAAPQPLPAPTGPPVLVEQTDLVREYAENPVAADAKYKGKRLRVSGVISEIGRRSDGKPFIGSCSVAGPYPPNTIYLVSEKEAAETERGGAAIAVDGICRGRVEDGLFRANRRYTFYILFEDAKVYGR